MSQTAQVTMVETGTPSRSKGRGWARIDGVENSFATAKGRAVTITAENDADMVADLVVGVDLRRATRTEKLRTVIAIMVTGDEADTVTASLGTPQSYDVTVRGARRAV